MSYLVVTIDAPLMTRKREQCSAWLEDCVIIERDEQTILEIFTDTVGVTTQKVLATMNRMYGKCLLRFEIEVLAAVDYKLLKRRQMCMKQNDDSKSETESETEIETEVETEHGDCDEVEDEDETECEDDSETETEDDDMGSSADHTSRRRQQREAIVINVQEVTTQEVADDADDQAMSSNIRHDLMVNVNNSYPFQCWQDNYDDQWM